MSRMAANRISVHRFSWPLKEGGAISGLDSTWSEVAQIHAARLGSKDIKMCIGVTF